MKDRLLKILAEQTGQTLKRIEKDTDRDFFMSPEEAKKYGLIDSVLKKRQSNLDHRSSTFFYHLGNCSYLKNLLSGIDIRYRPVRFRIAGTS